MTDALRIGDVARSAGVNVQTLRYYERRGLVVPGFRRHSGQREYEASDVNRVRVIKTAQRLGFTLTEIQELFDLSAHRRGTGELRSRARAKIVEIEARIERLEAMRAELADVVDADCDSLFECSCGLGSALPYADLGGIGPVVASVSARPAGMIRRPPPPSPARGVRRPSSGAGAEPRRPGRGTPST
jgi:DNA-binding transcriptional MerR regulator